MVVAAEFSTWWSPATGSSSHRPDLLGLDRSGRVVVVEFKRSSGAREALAQVLTYGSLASEFAPDTLAAAHQQYLAGRGRHVSLESALELLVSHAGAPDEWPWGNPRLVLVAQRVSDDVPQAAAWLATMGLDINVFEARARRPRAGTSIELRLTLKFPHADVEPAVPYVIPLGPLPNRRYRGLARARQMTRSIARLEAELVRAKGLRLVALREALDESPGLSCAQVATSIGLSRGRAHRLMADARTLPPGRGIGLVNAFSLQRPGRRAVFRPVFATPASR